MKKLMFVLAGVLMFGISSCSYKTCPTYAKNAPSIEKIDASNTVAVERNM